MDWFSRESRNRKPSIFPLRSGFPVKIFPRKPIHWIFRPTKIAPEFDGKPRQGSHKSLSFCRSAGLQHRSRYLAPPKWPRSRWWKVTWKNHYPLQGKYKKMVGKYGKMMGNCEKIWEKHWKMGLEWHYQPPWSASWGDKSSGSFVISHHCSQAVNFGMKFQGYVMSPTQLWWLPNWVPKFSSAMVAP